jgi:hypothetical protein
VSPVSVITHVLAVALGVWGGLWLISRVAPDLPDPDTAAAVETPVDVEGDDPESLLRPGPLSAALGQLAGQIAAGDEIVSLELHPESLDAETGSGGVGLAPGDVPPEAPQRIADAIAAERGKVTLDDINFMLLRDGDAGPEWYVQLELAIDPPRSYVAPLDGTSAVPGG